MSKNLFPSAGASLLTLLAIFMQITGLFCSTENQCRGMEHVESGKSSGFVSFNSGRLEVEFVLLGSHTLDHTTVFFLQEGQDEKNVIQVQVTESSDNKLKEVKVWFCANGKWNYTYENEAEEEGTGNSFTFKKIRKALFELSDGVFQVTLRNAADDDGPQRVHRRSKAPIKDQEGLTMKSMVSARSAISSLFYWLLCCPLLTPPPNTTPCTPPPTPPSTPSTPLSSPTSTECKGPVPSTTFGSLYFYLVVAALVVMFLILLVLAYRDIKRNLGSQKAETESNEVENNGNQNYYDELNLTQVSAARLHQREQGLPGEANSECRDSINSIYNYIPNT